MNVLHEEGNKMMLEFVSKFDSSSSVTEMWDYIESKLANILDLELSCSFQIHIYPL